MRKPLEAAASASVVMVSMRWHPTSRHCRPAGSKRSFGLGRAPRVVQFAGPVNAS